MGLASCFPPAASDRRGTKGKAGGYPGDIKMIYSAGGDLFNQAPNANKMARSLDGVELIVAQDHFLTPTARYDRRPLRSTAGL